MAFGYQSSYGTTDPLNSYRTQYQGYQPVQPQAGNNYMMQPQQSQSGNNYMMPPQVQPVGQQSIPQQQPVTNSEIQWVKGIEGAKSYQVQPGTSIILMDSESQTFFIKSANAAGMPEIHAYSFKEIYEINGQVISQAYGQLRDLYRNCRCSSFYSDLCRGQNKISPCRYSACCGG